MRFATGLPGLTRYPPITKPWEASLRPEDFQLVARTADELGFDSIAISEHIVMPAEMVELMGPFWTHALTAMAFVAGATTRIIVDSAVIVLPYHDPVVFAKAVSTLDLLSGGRVRLSIGVGHAEREFEMLGVAYHERGRMTDEYLAAMIELWTSDRPEFHGEYVSFEDVAFEPKPASGRTRRSGRRQLARGHAPGGPPRRLVPVAHHRRRAPGMPGPHPVPARVRGPHWTVRRRAAREHPRRRRGTPPTRRVVGRSCSRLPQGKQATVDAIGHLEEIGVTRTSVPVPPATSLTEYLDALQWVAEEVMPEFR